MQLLEMLCTVRVIWPNLAVLARRRSSSLRNLCVMLVSRACRILLVWILYSSCVDLTSLRMVCRCL